jgi:response regulator NasT
MHTNSNETLDIVLDSNDKSDSPKTILVVDDNSAVAELIMLTLRRLGHACVEIARGGKEALEIATRIRPDLVIMDIDMPEMDGVETAQHLNLLHPCPIIFSTGLCDNKTMRRARDIPSVTYLIKPFSANELYSAVCRSAIMSTK